MALIIQCPSCQRKLNVPDQLLGKRVKCPSCGKGVEASATAIQPQQPKKSSTDIEAPQPKKTPKDAMTARRPPAVPADDGIIDEPEYDKPRPSRRRSRDDAEDDEDRPSRRRPRDDDEDDEDRPSRRRRREVDYDDDEDDEEPSVRRRRPRAPHRGVLILVLGISTLLLWCCPLAGLIMSAVATNMARTDLAAMKLGRMDRSGRGMTMAGNICAIVGAVLSIVNAVVGIILQVTGHSVFR